ncbi:Hypothetical protein ADU72_1268 [Pediococcus damnosus]|uniref:Uncharacterized protein n=1 Tax=Pediococcus damnosus TaxID=51663 RepID=A0AAC9B1Z7_9LACO|nr:hypothetical protein [Pediococcus damnosus]AMV60625.1 Hypothetical protein ADU69_0964 [Pediococcus damnosus]AMV62916.1 Hypothetical protein ADU70_1432 [Pediococcus damnosus]AMV64940.1 Hypothetical protein ADU71_1042 [Pediococcus damnosus]AMV67201.1 Hypothetical protein ADU72_1268 [Pediococcus damnosus]AMV69196.1 Hypothetical protein ADU73_0790 [Pediococcus damnosus]
MDTNDWVEKQLKELIKTSKQYEDRAFYLALSDLVQEQQKRLTQSQGEVDGRTWNPSKW